MDWVPAFRGRTLVGRRPTVLPSGALLCVSRGIGHERSHAPCLRFLCRPELTVIEFTPE